MWCAIKIAWVLALITICSGQFDGRYQAQTTPRYNAFRPASTAGRYTGYTPGRYNAGTSGKYTAGNAGRYTGNAGRYTGDGGSAGRYTGDGGSGGRYRGNNDGRYVPNPNDGKYVHKDDPYKHLNVGGGGYSGSPDRGTGGGYYKGDKDKQNPYKDKQYGGGGSGGGGGDGGGGGGGGGGGEGQYQDTGAGRGSSPGSGAGSQGRRPNAGAAGGGASPSGAGRPYGGAAGAGAGVRSGAGAGAGTGRPYGGASAGKGDYGRFDKKYDIIHLARKGYRDGYHYTYETANGILAEETSQDAVVTKDGATTSNKAGWYEYTGPDGKLYHVDYTAGEDGFVPKADFIPTIPPLIQKALEWLKTHEDKSQQQVSRQ